MKPAPPMWSSEPALRDDHDIARPNRDIGGDITPLDQVLEADAVELAAVGDAENARGVAIGKLGKSSDGDHHVEQGHVFPVSKDLGFGGLADDPDRLAVRTNEVCNDHRP